MAEGTAAQCQPCRADRATPWGSHAWIGVLLSVLAIAGFWMGTTFMRQLDVADRFEASEVSGPGVEGKYALWSILIGAVVGFAATAGACFVIWLIGLLRLFDRIRARMVGAWVVTVLVVAVTVIVSLWRGGQAGAAPLDAEVAEATRPVTVVVWLCAVPGLVALLGLRNVAQQARQRAGHEKEPGECRLALVLRLRTELRRLLATFGVLLTLIVVATAARRDALVAADTTVQIPATLVILYGLLLAVLLGLFYAAASGPIDRLATELLDDVQTLGDPAAAGFSEAVRRRAELAGVMGSGGSWKSFETGALIAAPLVSALVGGALGS
jgi:hypothetical protein